MGWNWVYSGWDSIRSIFVKKDRSYIYKTGGVFVEEHKETTESIPIKEIEEVYDIMVYPLKQHAGAPATPTVKPGDVVKEGQIIGRVEKQVLGANVHSSVNGVVKEIKKLILTPMNVVDAVYIEVDRGASFKDWYAEREDWQKLSEEEIMERIWEAGIVGQGGAAFPTDKKIAISKQKNAKVMIINGAECEPYITIDHRLMLEKYKELIEGVKIVAKILKPERIIFAIGDNKLDAYKLLKELVKEELKNGEVKLLYTTYPHGGEKVIIEAILGITIPEGKFPPDVGVYISNVATYIAIYEAVVYKKPLIHRYLTINGEFEVIGNYRVRVGIPVGHILDMFKVKEEEYGKIITGGPMMGTEVTNEWFPVMKYTNAVIAMPKETLWIVDDNECIRCTLCVNVCPVGLVPSRIVKLLKNMHVKEAVDNGLMTCFECGACTYVCPSHIPLVSYIRWGKNYYLKIMKK